MTVAFLSEEYFAALEGALSQMAPVEGDETVVVGQVVTGAPGGERRWSLVLRPGAPPELRRRADGEGAEPEPGVTLLESYEAAWALLSGARTAAELLEAGELTIRGDARLLVSSSPALEAVAAASGAMRPLTTRGD